MKLLDRYIVRRFLITLIWAILTATVAFLAVNMVEQLDKFLDSKVPMKMVIRYYALFVPYIIYLILPVAVLLATMFTIGGMTMTNELMAMHVSGVPFSRILMILLVCASLIAFLGFINGEAVVPVANRMRMDIERYEVKKLSRESRARHGRFFIQIEPGKQLYISRYIPKTGEAFGIEMIETEEGRISRRYDAPKMIWIDNTWKFQTTVRQTFREDGSIEWESDIDLQLSGPGLRPDELEKVQIKQEEMNWLELQEFIERLKRGGGKTRKWEVDLLSKVSLPFAAIIIVLFGAPIAAVRRRGGTALGFGLALFVCFVYFGFIQIGKVLGYSGVLPPFAAAWIGNALFGLFGIGILLGRSV